MELPAYFDSQVQAAAMLNINVYDVKAAKAAGCPAFRGGGRIRSKEFVAWLKKRNIERERQASEETDEKKNLIRVVGETLMGLDECGNLNLLTAEQHFEFCKTIVEASKNSDVLHFFVQHMFSWLRSKSWFGDRTFEQAIWAMLKEHPKITKWVFQTLEKERLVDPKYKCSCQACAVFADECSG